MTPDPRIQDMSEIFREEEDRLMAEYLALPVPKPLTPEEQAAQTAKYEAMFDIAESETEDEEDDEDE